VRPYRPQGGNLKTILFRGEEKGSAKRGIALLWGGAREVPQAPRNSTTDRGGSEGRVPLTNDPPRVITYNKRGIVRGKPGKSAKGWELKSPSVGEGVV